MKTTAALLCLVLLGVTAFLPLGCARHNKTETFASYGFSFDYPAGFTVDDEPREGESNSDSEGRIFVRKYDDERVADQFMLNWYSSSSGSAWMDNEESLLAHFQRGLADLTAIWEEEGYESVQVEEVTEDSHGSHLMLYVYYEFTATGVGGRVHGTFGEMCCDDSCRIFEFLTMGRGAGSQADAVALLSIFSSSLVCH
jgi:hypothetical protein